MTSWQGGSLELWSATLATMLGQVSGNEGDPEESQAEQRRERDPEN